MTRPPNLLFLLTDEQRRDTLACYGNTFTHMPHLNALAQQSCIFDDAHCTDPVCTPSRGSIITGLYPHAHGATELNTPLHPHVRCLPQLMPEQARTPYRVEYHGKWHLGDELYPQHGHDRFVSIEDIYWQHFSPSRDRTDRSDYHHYLLEQGFTLGNRDTFSREFACQLPEPVSKPAFQAGQACQFIRQHRDRPWMMTVSILEPHMPFHSCRDGQYDPATVPMFPGFDHVPDEDPDAGPLPQAVRDRLRLYREQGFGGVALSTEAGWREVTAKYLGLCSLVDTHLGRVLQTLRDCGLEDDTIVVFTSDHGEMMGSHRLLEKKLLYREATAVPLLIRLPGQRKAVRMTGPMSQVDLTPTLLELLGVPSDAPMHGRSLAALMSEAVSAGQDQVTLGGAASPCVIVQHEASRTLISSDGWRYSCYANPEEAELFNHRTDPGERRNLAHQPAFAEKCAVMHTQLREWQARTDDPWPLPAPPRR